MRIGPPRIIQEHGRRTYLVDVQSARGNETLCYSLPDSFGDLLTHSSDAPLVALLIPAMAMGEDIRIDGIISDRLSYNLSRPVQSVLRHIIPSLRQVKIYPGNVGCTQTQRASGVATGFSGGIDSYCLLADHYYSQVPKRFKVTHLLFNNVGSHGLGGERLFRKRYERLVPTAERIGLPFLTINSNLDSFYSEKLLFQQTHTLRNASVALLLQGGIGRYMYASTHDYLNAFVGSTYDTAYSDTITLPLLSTDTIDLFSVGSDYTRVQKTLRVAELPDSYETLDVCLRSNPPGGQTNCSRCWKCLRTLATLEIGGCLDRYATSFDLNAYTSQREAYFATLFNNPDPLMQEIVQFAKERNYSFPRSSRLLYLWRILRWRLSLRALRYHANRLVNKL